MKIWIISILIIVSGFCYQKIDSLKTSTWRLNLITLNSDTIFYKGEPGYTYRYNYRINKDSLKNESDSLKIKRIAIKKYSECDKMRITFINDTTFSITKMRSGGRIYISEKDTGTYTIMRDTIHMINKTRNNYKLWFVWNKLDNKIYCSDEMPNHKIYWEFRKEK